MRRFATSLLFSAALAAWATAAEADALSDLKAEIVALDDRMAALEAAPAVPQDMRLLTVSEGALVETPGAPLTARARAAYAGRATFMGLVPTADAPGGATISWSGYTRAGVVYEGQSGNTRDKAYVLKDGQWVRDPSKDLKPSGVGDDWSVGTRGQLLVQAKTETSLGEVGAELELRADLSGNTNADVYAKVAWGYWDVTPDLTFGGGYNQSIGDIVYGYDGSCTCYFTDNADVDFNPGDTTQLRLGYQTGPVSVTAALESGALDNENDAEDNAKINSGKIGVAGEIAYTGTVFNGEIAGVWRESSESQTGASQIWQVGVGGSVALGDVATIAVAAATGEGPYEVQTSGTIIDGLAYDNTWWGASLWSSIALGDQAHMELAAGYKKRDGDQGSIVKDKITYDVSDVDYHTYAVMGGLYYTPVDQLTLGIEGEWYTTSTSADAAAHAGKLRYDVQAENDTVWADVVAVWSF